MKLGKDWPTPNIAKANRFFLRIIDLSSGEFKIRHSKNRIDLSVPLRLPLKSLRACDERVLVHGLTCLYCTLEENALECPAAENPCSDVVVI